MSACLPELPEGHRYHVAGATGIVFAHDWTRWLAAGETILASEWSTPDDAVAVEETGTINNPSPGFTSTQVSGGTAGVRARIDEEVTTSLGQHPRRSIFLHVIATWPPA